MENQRHNKRDRRRRIKDLTGRRFGRLLVIGNFDMRDIKGRALFACICDCGCDCVCSSHNLISGRIKSCGCLSGHPCRQPALFSHRAGVGVNPWDIADRGLSCLTC